MKGLDRGGKARRGLVPASSLSRACFAACSSSTASNIPARRSRRAREWRVRRARAAQDASGDFASRKPCKAFNVFSSPIKRVVTLAATSLKNIHHLELR